MANISESVAIKAPIERVFEVVSDFERYPDFLDEMEDVRVVKRTKKSVQVAFTAKLVAPIKYTLDMKLSAPSAIEWSLVEGDFMEGNDGSWQLTSLEPNLTDATFSVDIRFPFWVPKSMGEGTLKSGLPKMLASFKAEAERKGGKGANKAKGKG